MKNLKLLHCTQVEEEESLLKDTLCVTIDCDTRTVFCATKGGDIVQLDPRTKQFVNAVNLKDEGHLTDEQSVTNLQHLPEYQGVCAITDSGSVLMWYYTVESVECVGNFNTGITGSAWSPDQELLVLISGVDSLILMTRDFDLLHETALHPDQFGEAEFINVGWGKKETQFHGSEGKEAAKTKKETVEPALEWDDRKAYISWRGDGQYFVTSTINPQEGYRQLRVWSRESVLHSTGEVVAGQEQGLAWKPTGSLIVSSQMKPNKHEIIFFELNGLRHGEFTLPFDVNKVQVKKMLWNIDSTILLVWCEELNNNEENFQPKSYIQLWTVNNYHWYLKQSLVFDPVKEKKVACVLWDPEQACQLHVVTADGCYLHYTWYWETVVSDNNVVAVIDGAQVLVTPMALQILPPPMYAYKLLLPAPANQVFFISSSSDDTATMADIGVLLHDGCIAVFTYSDDNISIDNSAVEVLGGNGFAIKSDLPHLQGVFRPLKSYDSFPLAMHSVLSVREGRLVYCVEQEGTSLLCQAVLSQEDATFSERSYQLVAGNIFNMIRSSYSNTVFVQTLQGKIMAYNPDNQVLSEWETKPGCSVSFPQCCPTMAVCQINEQEVILGLTSRYRLYMNNNEVATNCTSMVIHKEFLILTTLSHTCRFLNLMTSMKDLPKLQENKEHPFDEIVRRVERGSCLVTVVRDGTQLVMQMPRGNLETVHPRALLLSSVQKKLNSQEFQESLRLMRKHRMNMNLAYDHNPALFMSNIAVFIDQVSADNLTLFLSELGEEDVTQTMYAGAYPNKSQMSSYDDKEEQTQLKVNLVCDAVLNCLCGDNKDRHTLPILTAHVKKSPPELERALELIHTLKVQPNNGTSMEVALRHLLCMVDINQLYNVALGMYDFDIVLMIAERSQKDPKEYLPFLNNLRSLETNYQRFSIDKHLKRFSKALEHIVKCGHDRFNECLQFIEEHKLHQEALKLYEFTSADFKLVANSYADELVSQKYHNEAGIMYIKANKWQSALQCFQKSLNVRQAMCMVNQLDYEQDKIAEIGRSMAVSLKDQNRHQEAAILYEQYVEDVEEAIVALIDGALWEESLRLMYKHRRRDFIESNLKEAVLIANQNQMDSLESLYTDFRRHTKRLAVVREEKERKRLEMFDDEGPMANADLYSEASSIAGDSMISVSTNSSQKSSLHSSSTGRTSRNRRKTEKKKWSLKEGSRFEEFALLEELGKIIKHVDILRADIHSLLLVMVQFNYECKAEKLQEFYDNFLTTIEKGLPALRQPVREKKQELSFGPNVTANVIAEAVQKGQSLQSDAEADLAQMVPASLNQGIKWKLHVIGKKKH